MPTLCKSIATTLIQLGTVFQLYAQGVIVPNGIFTGNSGGFPGGEVDVAHNPNNPGGAGSWTGFGFFQVNATTFQFATYLDVGVRVFFVSPNQPVSLQPILAQTYTELSYPNTYTFASGVHFYVGVYTGNQSSPPPNGIYSDPLFGWAELMNNNGTIQLLNGALEYGGAGIYAGTQNIIPTPEPSTWALLLTGGGVLFYCRMRHPRRGHLR